MRSPYTVALRRLAAVGCILGWTVIGAASAQAQSANPSPAAGSTWPDKRVRIIAAGPGGGSADILARVLADGLSRETGQPITVEPKPGAGGILAVNDLSQSPQDGYTLLVGVSSLVSEIPHVVKMRNDMAKEIKPLVEIGHGGLVMVGSPSVPARTFSELLAWAKANTGKVSYASYTPGTLSHVLGLQLNEAAGLDMTHVGYKGSTSALTDVMGNHVPLMFDGLATSLPLIKTGKIKAFALSAPKRSAVLPDVPTFAELGYPQLTAESWMGLWAKPGVPAQTQAQIRAVVMKLLENPDTRKRVTELGLEPGSTRSPEALSSSLAADYRRVGDVLKAINFKPE